MQVDANLNHRIRDAVQCPWVLFSLFIPGIAIAGEAYISHWAGYSLLAGGMLILLFSYTAVFMDGAIRIHKRDFAIKECQNRDDLSLNTGLIQLITVGGAFLTVFAPIMIIGAMILDSITRSRTLSAMTSITYLASVLVSLVMTKIKPWLSSALGHVEFTELAASFFASAFIFGVITYFLSQQLARLITLSAREAK